MTQKNTGEGAAVAPPAHASSSADDATNDLLVFLRRRIPMALTAIDKSAARHERGTSCRVFSDPDAAMAWARERNEAGGQIYIVNNPPPQGWRPRDGNPPKVDDITERTRLQVDIDPVGEDHETAREHAIEIIDQVPFSPTTLVDSGRGIQAHWDLPRPTNELDRVRAANERLIEWLRAKLDPTIAKCDGVANANRLMRLPGFINSRTGRAAMVVAHVEGRCCSLEDVEALPGGVPAPANDAKLTEQFHRDFQDKVQRYGRVSEVQRELLAKLSEIEATHLDPSPNPDDLPTNLACLQAVHGVRGRDDVKLGEDGQVRCVPLDEAGYSRSEAALAFAGECVSHGATLLLVMSFLMSGDWPISAHIREQMNPMRAARRALAHVILSDAAAGVVVGDDGAAPFSQEHLALIFAKQNRYNLRYVAEWGHWYVWDGQRWGLDRVMLVRNEARRLARWAASKVDDPKFKYRLSGAAYSAALQQLAQTDPRLAAVTEVWDADPTALNTPGGIVSLDTGDIGPSDQSALCTKITRVAPAPAGARPERWLRFLNEVTNGDDEYVAYLQRLCGYLLTGDTTEHALFFAWGTGRNGKSVFVNTIRWVMGDYGTSTAADTITANAHPQHPTELADLRGARLVTVQETEEGRRWAEAKIKQMTGGDAIKARFMRQDFFEYTPQFKLLIAGNHRPGLSTVDEAIRRRIHLLPFTVTIPEERVDGRLEEKLRAEAPAILRWMIDGCMKWRAEGLGRPERVRGATVEYLQDEDKLGRWIAECCERDAVHKELAADLFKSYRVWCEETNERAESKRKFGSMLRDRGEKPDNTGGNRGYIGLKLTPEARDAARWGYNRGAQDEPF